MPFTVRARDLPKHREYREIVDAAQDNVTPQSKPEARPERAPIEARTDPVRRRLFPRRNRDRPSVSDRELAVVLQPA
jgi:hypothetical protein